jgi:hypothetical protein
MRKILAAFASVATASAGAASLPSGLSREELGRVVRGFAVPALHRPYTGHALVSDGSLGVDLGVETAFVFRRDLLDYGKKDGVVPRITPVPRVWGAVDLVDDFKLSLSFSPSALFDGIATAGGALQWGFWLEPSKEIRASAYLGYSYIDVFGDLKNHVTEMAVQVSKDLLVWQPYGGFGVAVANATANEAILKTGVEKGPHTEANTHLFVGARIDLVAKLSFQFDVFGTRPAVSILLEKSF